MGCFQLACTLTNAAEHQQLKYLRMNNVNPSFTTKKERHLNSRKLNYFTYAFNSHDVNAICEMLHPKGMFFGKYTKERVAGVFYSFFFGKEGVQELHSVHINKGWSLSPIPGSEVLEIRCSDGDPFLESEVTKKFGEPQDDAIGEKVFRFCFAFKDDLISRIEYSKHFVGQDDCFKFRN